MSHLSTNKATAPEPRPAGNKESCPPYLQAVVEQLNAAWPDNRIVNIVCHGHSVPAGYFRTPAVHTFESYPHLLHRLLKNHFPNAVANVIVTAIGGEDAERGAARFERDVMVARPSVVTIDYALNDRRIGLERAESAWRRMIEMALEGDAKLILLTPSPDLDADPAEIPDKRQLHSEQVRALASEYHVGLADSDAAFESYCRNGGVLGELMAQANHPNHLGHQIIAHELLRCFGPLGT